MTPMTREAIARLTLLRGDATDLGWESEDFEAIDLALSALSEQEGWRETVKVRPAVNDGPDDQGPTHVLTCSRRGDMEVVPVRSVINGFECAVDDDDMPPYREWWRPLPAAPKPTREGE